MVDDGSSTISSTISLRVAGTLEVTFFTALRYLGHVLRMPPDRIVRRALVALVKGGTCYPEGSLFDDCGVASLRELVDTAKDRSAWHAKVASLTRQQ